MKKLLKKYWWIPVLILAVILFMKWCDAKRDLEFQQELQDREESIVRLEKANQNLYAMHNEKIKEKNQEIDTLNENIKGRDSENEDLKYEIKSLKSESAEMLVAANADIGRILREKRKDEQTIVAMKNVVLNLELNIQDKDRIIEIKDQIIYMWMWNFYREREAKIRWRDNYEFLKKKSDPSKWHFIFGGQLLVNTSGGHAGIGISFGREINIKKFLESIF